MVSREERGSGNGNWWLKSTGNACIHKLAYLEIPVHPFPFPVPAQSDENTEEVRIDL